MDHINHEAAIAHVSPDGTILGANAAFAAWLGYQPEELKHHRFWYLLYGEDQVVFRDRFTQVAGSVRPLINLRLCFIHPKGQLHCGYLTLLWSFDCLKNSYYAICLLISAGQAPESPMKKRHTQKAFDEGVSAFSQQGPL